MRHITTDLGSMRWKWQRCLFCRRVDPPLDCFRSSWRWKPVSTYDKQSRDTRHSLSTCSKLVNFAILVQMCKIFVRNIWLLRIPAEFCKICEFRKQGPGIFQPQFLSNSIENDEANELERKQSKSFSKFLQIVAKSNILTQFNFSHIFSKF